MYPIVQAYPKYLHTKIAVRVVKNKYSHVDNSACHLHFIADGGGWGGGGGGGGILESLKLSTWICHCMM